MEPNALDKDFKECLKIFQQGILGFLKVSVVNFLNISQASFDFYVSSGNLIRSTKVVPLIANFY